MAQTPAVPEVEIRHCSTLQEYEECVRLEHDTWGEDIAVPSAMFVVAHHTGGQVLAAFDGPKMVGFTLALAGVRGGAPYLHSHMTAVLPEYRDCGIGRRLKLFQREDALNRGIRLIEWTFDPLDLKNAYFNFIRLGAIARRFIPNCYGVTESPLHAGLPTDRLVAEWWIDSERVQQILGGNSLPAKVSVERLPLPTEIAEIKSQDPPAAVRIQTCLRGQFIRAFAGGLVAASIEPRGARTDYIVEPAAGLAGLQLPELHED
ncbi:MAG TPA: GNAT family N-acetyltransferase [Candidatus Acidoferrales bacterium]|nr:GNAT family N-acetyltransferase [Candidatus Acidoferrales bacterium]